MTGQELRQLRKRTGLSTERFAFGVLGVSASEVGQWERGETAIRPIVARAIRILTERYEKTHHKGHKEHEGENALTGPELRQLRKKLGLRRAAFAEALGVSVMTIARWQACRKPINALLSDGIRYVFRHHKGHKGQERGISEFTGAELKKLRQRMGLTQEKFAHAVGISARSLLRWERGATAIMPLRAAGIRARAEHYLGSPRRTRRTDLPGFGPTLTGEELRRLRRAAGLTQIALAKEIGVFDHTVNRWEKGHHPIRRLESVVIRARLSGPN